MMYKATSYKEKNELKLLNFTHLMSIYESNYYNFKSLLKRVNTRCISSIEHSSIIIKDIHHDKHTRIFKLFHKFKYQNNKVIHYKNKTTWKDNLGNYGVSNCLGLIVSDVNENIIDYKMYCKYLKNFILLNNQTINILSYQKDLKTCLKEFLLMEASIVNYVLFQPTDKKSTILTTQMI